MGGRSDKLYAKQNQVHASAHCLFKLVQKLTVLSATPRRSPPWSNRHFKKQHTRFKRAVSLFSIELSTARHTPSTLVIRPKAHDSTSHSFYSLSNNQQVYEPNSSYHKTQNVFFCHSTLILTTLNTSVYAFVLILLITLTAQNSLICTNERLCSAVPLHFFISATSTLSVFVLLTG